MRKSAPASRKALGLAALYAIAGYAWSATARATPQDLFGFGTRTPALAMTGVSYADDYEATFANPAGLARARRRGLHLALSAAVYDLRIDGHRDPLDSARGLNIGATLPLPFGDVLEDRLVLGIGVYTPQQVLLRGDVAFTDVPQWPVLSRAQSLAINVGLGFDFHSTVLEGLRIGAGVSGLASLIGAVDVRLDETNRFASTVETQLLTTFSPIVGVSYQRGQWDAGLVYRHEVRSAMSLAIRTMDLPVTLPILSVGGLVQYDPAQVAAEVSFRPVADVRVIANLTYRMWSLYPGPQQASTASSYRAPAPGFSDTISPRVAVEGTLHDARVGLQLRGGYAFELSPSPPARLAPWRNPDGSPSTLPGGASNDVAVRWLDGDRHVLTAGLGVTYDFATGERFRFDLYGQAHVLADRTHAVSASGNDAGDPSRFMKTGGAILGGGWSLALEF